MLVSCEWFGPARAGRCTSRCTCRIVALGWGHLQRRIGNYTHSPNQNKICIRTIFYKRLETQNQRLELIKVYVFVLNGLQKVFIIWLSPALNRSNGKLLDNTCNRTRAHLQYEDVYRRFAKIVSILILSVLRFMGNGWVERKLVLRIKN